MADDKPGFGDAPSFISDVQMDYGLSPDKQAFTITFGNFVAKLVPSGPPVVSRRFSLVLPLKNVAAGASLTGGLQGGGVMQPGTGAMLIFRASGLSQVFDPLFDSPNATSFTKPITLAVPEKGDLRITIDLTVEGSATDPNAEADITVTALDLSIGPPQAPIHE